MGRAAPGLAKESVYLGASPGRADIE